MRCFRVKTNSFFTCLKENKKEKQCFSKKNGKHCIFCKVLILIVFSSTFAKSFDCPTIVGPRSNFAKNNFVSLPLPICRLCLQIETAFMRCFFSFKTILSQWRGSVRAMQMNSKSLPCVRGGGFCVAKDGGVVVIHFVFVVIKCMLLRVTVKIKRYMQKRKQ